MEIHPDEAQVGAQPPLVRVVGLNEGRGVSLASHSSSVALWLRVLGSVHSGTSRRSLLLNPVLRPEAEVATGNVTQVVVVWDSDSYAFTANPKGLRTEPS